MSALAAVLSVSAPGLREAWLVSGVLRAHGNGIVEHSFANVQTASPSADTMSIESSKACRSHPKELP